MFVLQSAEGESGIEALMLKMKQLTEATEEEPSPEEIIKRFEKIESQSAECKYLIEKMMTVYMLVK